MIHAAALDDARRNFFKRIKRFTFDRSFVIEWLAKCVHDTAQGRFAHGNRKKPAGRFGFVAFRNFRRFTQQNGADFGFFEVQGETEHAVWKFDHLIKHHVAQTFDARNAIARLAHNADVALGCRCF